MGIKNFECLECSKRFTTKGHLKDHEDMRHKDDRRFQCDICQEKFHRNSILKIHLRKHSKEKPYKCTLCDKSFSESGNLRTHIKCHVCYLMNSDTFIGAKIWLLMSTIE